MARVAEKRQVTESGFWGREVPSVQKDIPAYWSTASHGQPFNDVRLTLGSGARWKVEGPASLRQSAPKNLGPAAAQLDNLRKSLKDGTAFDHRTGAPKALTEEDRQQLLDQMPPHHRIQALRRNFDRDTASQTFRPWTEAVDPSLTKRVWEANRERAIGLALQRLESMMLTHVRFMMEARCKRAKAPFTNERDILKKNFMLVDETGSGRVSLAQFLQVWQNVLQLWQYKEDWDYSGVNPKRILARDKRLPVSRNAAAAIFVKYGFDKDGLLPYDVFINALTSTPARLLGFEIILDNKETGKNGLASEVDVALALGGCKVLYAKSRTGAFPPSGFEPEVAFRSRLGPRATMFLEHVYGYEGNDNLANNLFFNHQGKTVFYVAGVCVVFDKERHLQGKTSQRFFFGHSNDILCLTQHPGKRLFASGQQAGARVSRKAAGGETDLGLPYVCIWDSEDCSLVQRIDHGKDMRGVVACGFSGNGLTGDDRSGSVLVTVCSDNQHTVHVWRWWRGAGCGKDGNPSPELLQRARYIPGWYWGPTKKAQMLEGENFYFSGPGEDFDPDDEERDNKLVAQFQDFVDPHGREFVIREAKEEKAHTRARAGLDGPDGGVRQNYVPNHTLDVGARTRDGTAEIMAALPGFNGTPPQVHGVQWNPFRVNDGGPGSEMLTYGPKHLKTWYVNDEPGQPAVWIGTNAQFDRHGIASIKCAAWVPAMHRGRAPGDSCIATGFADGGIGIWTPPYPTRAGKAYCLTKVYQAHGPGKALGTNQDGETVYAGCAVVQLRRDGTLISGGGDGVIKTWRLEAPTAKTESGMPKRGTVLRAVRACEVGGSGRCGCRGAERTLKVPGIEESSEGAPILSGMACLMEEGREIIVAGTNQQDIWEVEGDGDAQVLIDGHTATTDYCASHPDDPSTFATIDHAGICYLWDASRRVLRCSAQLGLAGGDSIAFSNEPVMANPRKMPNWKPEKGHGYHIAVGGTKGRLVILDASTLQPIVTHKRCKGGIRDVSYTPGGVADKYLAAASADLCVDIYNVAEGYQFVARCVGHSASVEFVDWSLPIQASEPARLHSRCILMSQDAATEVLYFDPKTGRKISENQRDRLWHTRTGPFGFDVMGIWPDDSDRTDINAVDRSRRGAPRVVEYEGTARVIEAPAEVCSDGIRGCGYLVAGDDYSHVKMFNYPVVWDDAPCRVFKGHSSHVTCTRFSCDDRHVFSVGGRDQAVFQWRTIGVCQEDESKDRPLLDAVDAIARKAARDHPMLKEVQVNMGAMHQTLTATEKKVEMPDVKDVREEEHAEAGGQGKGAEGDLPTVRL